MHRPLLAPGIETCAHGREKPAAEAAVEPAKAETCAPVLLTLQHVAGCSRPPLRPRRMCRVSRAGEHACASGRIDGDELAVRDVGRRSCHDPHRLRAAVEKNSPRRIRARIFWLPVAATGWGREEGGVTEACLPYIARCCEFVGGVAFWRDIVTGAAPVLGLSTEHRWVTITVSPARAVEAHDHPKVVPWQLRRNRTRPPRSSNWPPFPKLRHGVRRSGAGTRQHQPACRSRASSSPSSAPPVAARPRCCA